MHFLQTRRTSNAKLKSSSIRTHVFLYKYLLHNVYKHNFYTGPHLGGSGGSGGIGYIGKSMESDPGNSKTTKLL